ncbi:serine/threonine-protein kinase LMTK1 [Megalops cyprinoides]|uniref:serine/threonine-protein kinase LMTK1 n=1 Tax=Megalops cyprinoides TaxID=118141 RepID=UPI0018645184|nr:serine/threonine-protein kinase LMTK1 [Megalops cyprinoides]
MKRRMSAALCVMVMSSSFFNPSFAFSSHFDSDGAPLSELSWSSSLAVVAVSFSGLFTFIFLMLACLCCKKGDIGFKEFENAEGEDYHADLLTLASPASHAGPDVYILPLTEVSLPVSKQPGRSVQLLKSTDLGRHSLLYLKEIGHGWFGKVLLGEVNSGLSSTQVVVKELKASASVQDQMQFMEEVQPYRALQHPALLQCLAQCSEVTPYLLVMEFCPLGDLKGYLRSCRAADSVTPDPLILQRMACEIASGLLHLHKHNYIHSDLALRNCLLTADVTVKIGDYGLSHNKYKEDYFVTPDQLWIPLRWLGPELVDEVHGNLLVVDQTKPSNIWSLGVTIWELFELGNQPYRHYTDRQVLTYAVKEQQLKLPKPLLKVPLSDRWYEVMQFCWLQPDQRPNAEEVHLLLTYLCAKGVSEAEDDFEKRWNSLRPNGSHVVPAADPPPPPPPPPSSSSSSFPLLERFSAGDGYHPEPGDDVLTVTETSRGLNFEYKWEQARPEPAYCPSSAHGGPLGQGDPRYQDAYYPPAVGSCGVPGLTLGVSPSYYEPERLHAPGVVPVLGACSPSSGSDYYIRIEDPAGCSADLDYAVCAYSPEYQGSSGGGSFATGSGDSAECTACPAATRPDPYWPVDVRKASAYDSDSSPAVSLTMEPLLGQDSGSSPLRPWESGHYVSYKDRDGGYYYEPPPSVEMDHYLLGELPEPPQESWGSRSLRQALGELENPLGISPSLGSPGRGYSSPYLGSGQEPILGKSSTGGCYYDMMGSLRSTMPGPHPLSPDVEPGGSLFAGPRDSEEDLFLERGANTWTSNRSANNNSLRFKRRPAGGGTRESRVDFHYTLPSTDVEDSWPRTDTRGNLTFCPARPLRYPEDVAKDSGCLGLGKHHTLIPSNECNTYIYLCHGGGPDQVIQPVPCLQPDACPQFVDPLSGVPVRNYALHDYSREKNAEVVRLENEKNRTPSTRDVAVGTSALGRGNSRLERVEEISKADVVVSGGLAKKKEGAEDGKAPGPTPSGKPFHPGAPAEPVSEGVDGGFSSGISLVDIGDCSDDDVTDVTDVTSGVFTDFAVGFPEVAGDAPPALRAPGTQAGTPDSVDSIDPPSAAGSCEEALSPASFRPSSPPKALDSGYDTENNESPEFVLKEPHEPREQEAFGQPTGKPSLGRGPELGDVLTADLDKDEGVSLSAAHGAELGLTRLSEKDPYRDSAYFSDYDTDGERVSRNNVGGSCDKQEGGGLSGREAEGAEPVRPTTTMELWQPGQEEGDSLTWPQDVGGMCPRGEPSESHTAASLSSPVISTLSPSPPEMGGCLTKEPSQEEGLGLDSQHSGEEPSSECSASSISGESGGSQEPLPTVGNGAMGPGGAGDSPAESSSYSSASRDSASGVLSDIKQEAEKEEHLREAGKEEEAEDEGQDLTGEKLGERHLQEMKEDQEKEEGNLQKREEEEKEEKEEHETALQEMEVEKEKEEDKEELQEVETEKEKEEDEEDLREVEAEKEKEENKEDLWVVEAEKEKEEDKKDLQEAEVKDAEAGEGSSSGVLIKEEAAGLLGARADARGPAPSSPPPPLPPRPLESRVSPGDGEEADEEDGDSEDSEDSDEELRSYSVQEPSEESEEENPAVPVVVSDRADARNLRSLLKMPSLIAEDLADELDRKKKAVSFFDDVTVYLFDQESPTRELAEHGFPPGADSGGRGSERAEPHPQERVSDDSSDGNLSEESGGFEWEDDFPLLPSPSPMVSPVSEVAAVPESKPAAPFSRFTVSPSSISRFSITHVSDSDMDSAGGSSEDGERE